jgi:hypothetical protein
VEAFEGYGVPGESTKYGQQWNALEVYVRHKSRRVDLLKPTGYLMHHQVHIKQFTFCPHTVFISDQTVTLLYIT